MAGSLVFGFALVPLYDVLCQATGLNGKTRSGRAEELAARVDKTRTVIIEFTGNTMPGLPWEFRPNQAKLKVHPGAVAVASYYVRNATNRTIAGQAVPSISPGKAAKYFQKLDCFCFKQQHIGAGESREMPLMFVVSPDLPEDVRTITLSYAFFSVADQPGNPGS